MFFLELSCFFNDPMDVGNLISGFSSFSKSSLNIWKFTVHIQLKPGLENFEHYFASVWDECSCVIIWAFLGIAFLWDWNESWYFPVLWPFWLFQIHNAKECSNYHTIALIFGRWRRRKWWKNELPINSIQNIHSLFALLSVTCLFQWQFSCHFPQILMAKNKICHPR